MTNEILILTKTRELLSYIAGFFDGEGSLGIYSSSKKFNDCCLRVQIKQNESIEVCKIFKFLYENYEGFTSKTITYSGKTCLTYSSSGNNACSFLRDIMEFSLIKKEQIRLAIEWQEGRKPPLRNIKGRICPKPENEINRDIEYSNKIRLLKDTPLGEIYKPLTGNKSKRGCYNLTPSNHI
jgi:hypothetical protein